MNMNHTSFTQDGGMLLSDSDIDTMSGGYSSAGESLISENDLVNYLSDDQSQIGGGYDSESLVESEQIGGSNDQSEGGNDNSESDTDDDDDDDGGYNMANLIDIAFNKNSFDEFLVNHPQNATILEFLNEKLKDDNNTMENRIRAFYFLMMNLIHKNDNSGLKVELMIKNKNVDIKSEVPKMLTKEKKSKRKKIKKQTTESE